MDNSAALTEDLKTLGLTKGDSVVVHSSFKSLGLTDGQPSDLIDALIHVLLPEGALLFPNLNIPHEFTSVSPPVWDLKGGSVKETIGIMPQIFKDQYAEHFSVHPTHSMMGMGKKAASILHGHERTGYSCGPGTPWHKNALSGGKVLLIGVDQTKNTTYHCAEESLPNSYQLSAEPIPGTVIIDGKNTSVSSRLHVWCNDANYNVINEELEKSGCLIRGLVGQAQSLLIDAKGFLALCAQKMSINPRFFLI